MAVIVSDDFTVMPTEKLAAASVLDELLRMICLALYAWPAFSFLKSTSVDIPIDINQCDVSIARAIHHCAFARLGGALQCALTCSHTGVVLQQR